MGYYSIMDIYLKIKAESIEKFKKISEQDDIKSIDTKRHVLKRFFESITIQNDGGIYIEEASQKWYDSDHLAEFLSPYVSKGKIEFTGEDGEKWGYDFDGNGGVYNLIYSSKRGIKIN